MKSLAVLAALAGVAHATPEMKCLQPTELLVAHGTGTDTAACTESQKWCWTLSGKPDAVVAPAPVPATTIKRDGDKHLVCIGKQCKQAKVRLQFEIVAAQRDQLMAQSKNATARLEVDATPDLAVVVVKGVAFDLTTGKELKLAPAADHAKLFPGKTLELARVDVVGKHLVARWKTCDKCAAVFADVVDTSGKRVVSITACTP